MLKFAALVAIFPKKLKSIRPVLRQRIHYAPLILSYGTNATQNSALVTALHKYDHGIFLEREEAKYIYCEKIYGKQRASQLLPSFRLDFLWRGRTFHPVGLQIFFAQYNVFGTDSQYSTNFFPVAVDRCFPRARPQLRVLSFSNVTSRVVLANTIKNSLH